MLPAINTVLLTAREVNMGGKVEDVFPGVAPGLVVKDAKVVAVNNNSVVVQLTDDVVGSVSARHLSEGKNLVKNVKKKFPVGSAHPCHVVGLDWVGGVAVCSLHKSLLSGVMRIDELVVDSAPQSRSSCRPALSWTSGRTCPASFPTYT